MIKLTFCLRRKAGLTKAEFKEYWRETHAPLVAERAAALKIVKYVQVHTMNQPDMHAALQARNGGAPEPFDGVAELWFDSLDAFGPGDEAARRTVEELLADERNFIDLKNSPMWLGEEHVVVG